MEISRTDNIIKIKTESDIITTHSAESHLLFAILEKLEEIRCGMIDIEDSVNNQELPLYRKANE